MTIHRPIPPPFPSDLDHWRNTYLLTPRELSIISVLIRYPGEFVHWSDIAHAIFGRTRLRMYLSGRDSTRAAVSHLRRRLIKSPYQITTLRSAGYRLEHR